MRGIHGMSGLKYVLTFKGIIPLVCSDVEYIFPGVKSSSHHISVAVCVSLQ